MRYLRHNVNPKAQHKPKGGYAIPFFVVLAALTVVSFIIPLRPTQSYSEKRNLAEFPEFSTEALVSGTYFDDITTWFSDTFPGRESWIVMAGYMEELRGNSDIAIHDDNTPDNEAVTLEEQPTEEPTEAPTETAAPTETVGATEAAESTVPATAEPTAPPTEELVEVTAPTSPIEEWGGVDAGEAEISLGKVVRIGDTAFSYFTYSENASLKYAAMLNGLAERMEEKGVRVISAPPPTAIGVMVEDEYMEQLKCYPQDAALDTIHSNLDERVYWVDTVRTLIPHNNEYLYFRTDHHWTATAAYYVYDAICKEFGMESKPLEEFTEWDQGEFIGSLYYECKQSKKLRVDNVIAYVSDTDVSCHLYNADGKGFDWPMLTDMTKGKAGSKYMTFLAGDYALSVLTNNDMEDGPNCVVVKNSYGNCLAPFLTENYKTVYVIDYRKYTQNSMTKFVEKYDIQDIIMIPSMDATQSLNVQKMLTKLLK